MGSSPLRLRALRVALGSLDAVNRVAIVATLLAVAHQRAGEGVALSALASVTGAVAAVVEGAAMEAGLASVLDETIAAAAARADDPTSATRAERTDGAVLLGAAREVAVVRAVLLPQAIARAVALAIVVAFVVASLGVGWLALGVVAGLPIGALLLVAARRVERHLSAGWAKFNDVARDLGVLLDAGVELRAHDRERSFANGLRDGAHAMALDERRAATWRTFAAVLPPALALVSISAPARAGVAWATAPFGDGRAVDVGVLGASAALLALSLAQTSERVRSARTYRRTLDAILREATSGARPSASARSSIGERAIVVERASFKYPSASRATPDRIDFVWPPRSGLAITGENGAGKSTLALLLLGLLTPTEGSIRVEGLDDRTLRPRAAYLRQRAFLAPSESIRWHVALLAPSASDEAMLRALDRVSLLSVLRQRARRPDEDPLAIPMGELSGGERQRVLLSRALLNIDEGVDVIVLDEPEVFLDQEGRRTLRSLLEELVSKVRVLVVVHDDTVVPPSYKRIVCGRSDGARSA